MKLNNKVSYEMIEELALTDSELEAVHGGQGYNSPCDGGSPSYYGGGSPSYYGGGAPSYCGGGSPSYYGGGTPSYAPNYGSSFSPSYSTPFDASSCSGSTPSYMTISYTVPMPSTSSNPCGY